MIRVEDKHFKTALWGFSWKEVLEESSTCEQGIAKLEDNRVTLDIPFGQLLTDNSFYSLRSGTINPEEAEYLYGFTQDGWYLALANARSAGTGESSPGAPYQYVHATEILASKDRFDPSEQVKEAQVYMLGLREWYEKAPYSAHHYRDDRKTVYELNMKDGKAQNAVLYECDQYMIKICHHITQSPVDAGGFHVDHDCIAQIAFREPVARKTAETTMVRFSDFISLCVGFDAQITRIEYDIVGGSMPVFSYVPFVVGVKPTQWQLAMIPLRYQDLESHISESIELWLNANEHFIDIGNLLCSLLFNSWKLPLDLKFTGASQVLESLSKYKADTSALPKEQYQQRCERLNELYDTIEDQELQRWAKERIPGNTKGQRRFLKELLEKHSAISDWLIPNRAAFGGAQIGSRNYYAHRHNSKGALKGAQLYWHTEGVLLFCYAAVTELAGVPSTTIISGIRESSSLSRTAAKMKELYGTK